MSADSDMEKTEDPTGKKLEQAAEKGNIARSRDLATAFVLMGSSLALLVFGSQLAHATLTVCRRLFSLNLKDIQDPYQMFTGLGTAVNEVMPPFMKMIGVIVIAGIVGNTLLGGFNFTWYGASFRISKLDPLAGIKRMFGLQSLVELIKSILKVVVVGGGAYILLKIFFDDIMALSLMSSPDDIISAMYLLGWMFFGLCTSTLLIAAIDAPYQKMESSQSNEDD